MCYLIIFNLHNRPAREPLSPFGRCGGPRKAKSLAEGHTAHGKWNWEFIPAPLGAVTEILLIMLFCVLGSPTLDQGD